MGFIVGRAFPIIGQMANNGNEDAKRLMENLTTMPQNEVDEMVSKLMSGDTGANKPSSFSDVAKGSDGSKGTLEPSNDDEKAKFDNVFEVAVAEHGSNKAKRLLGRTKKFIERFGITNFEEQLDFFTGMIYDERGMRRK